MRTLLLLCCLVPGLLAGTVQAQSATQPAEVNVPIAWGPRIESEVFTYTTGGDTYQGYLAHNAHDETPRPAVLIVHEWWGLNEYVKRRADQLAALGFVALAVDMYGNGQIAEHPDEAGEFAQRVMQDWPAARARLEAAINELSTHPAVADVGMAAIGYCFGGGVVMNMALSGMPLEAAISFHGSPTLAARNRQEFAGVVQIHNGAADPLVSEEDLTAMGEALQAQSADVEIINYHGATHAFSNPDATAVGEEFGLPLGYDAAADAASWQAALLLLDRTLND
ncbi:dienelactone hydrolase family protein [Litchfieldella xinjiangensis]|uniref:dienelactone hydrolase family protein n=1 Tax=Litchfieldella xinjiangensis TaxID=1166948 RepID=UPI0005B9345A|nr:dienelactone hydrolase family protein [Halomonas xinjiangensis]